MKKFTAILLLALCVMMGSLDAQAQKKRTAGKAKAKARTTATALKVVAGEKHTYGTDLTTQDFSCKKGESYINVEYPVSGHPELVAAIRAEIKKRIYGKFTGSLDTPDALLRKGLADYSAKGFYGMNGETLTLDIKVSYSNPNAVTINFRGYEYAGGAHGIPFDDSITYLRSTGKPLTLSMLPSASTLRPYVVSGLLSSIGISRSEWDDYFMSPMNELTIPETVYLTQDGLTFIYSIYEIGPYSYGLPTSTIPYAEVRKFAGKELQQYLP